MVLFLLPLPLLFLLDLVLVFLVHFVLFLLIAVLFLLVLLPPLSPLPSFLLYFVGNVASVTTSLLCSCTL